MGGLVDDSGGLDVKPESESKGSFRELIGAVGGGFVGKLLRLSADLQLDLMGLEMGAAGVGLGRESERLPME